MTAALLHFAATGDEENLGNVRTQEHLSHLGSLRWDKFSAKPQFVQFAASAATTAAGVLGFSLGTRQGEGSYVLSATHERFQACWIIEPIQCFCFPFAPKDSKLLSWRAAF